MKIRLMHEHKIRQEWVIDALVALAIQSEFPEVTDAEVLGIAMVTMLAKSREKLSWLPWNRRRQSSVRQVICEVFKLDGSLVEPSSWKAAQN